MSLPALSVRRSAMLHHAAVTLPLLLVALTLARTGLAQTRLFMEEGAYNDPRIRSMRLDGSDVREVLSPPSSEGLAGLASDGNGKIYWSDGMTPGSISCANADGSGIRMLVDGLNQARGISLDRIHGKMYWTEAPHSYPNEGMIRRANLDGSGIETFYMVNPYTQYSFVGQPCVDAVNGYVYFGAELEIRRARLDGTSVETVVRGVTTVYSVAVDAAAGKIYFLDANTNSGYLGRANLDDTGFTVLYDVPPEGSGLYDLKIDPARGFAYLTDMVAGKLWRCRLDGSDPFVLRETPAGYSLSGIAFDTLPAEPIVDCNGNGIRDLDDVINGTSADCNGNGVPDECEIEPCATHQYVIDNGADPTQSSRQIGDGPTGFDQFQPFDIAADPGTTVYLKGVELCGWTINYHPAGFRATLFPDDGTGTFPDEEAPIRWVDFQYRFNSDSVLWVARPLGVNLAAGRYWIRLAPNADSYIGAAHVGIRGEPSFARGRRTGHIYNSTHSLALRLETLSTSSAPGGEESFTDGSSPAWLAAPEPNPSAGATSISWRLARSGRIHLEIFDATGRRVRSLVSASMAAGPGSTVWDGGDSMGRRAPSGAYLVRLTVDANGDPFVRTRRIVLLR